MNYKPYSPNCNTKKVADISSIVGKATVSGGCNFIEMGLQDGLSGKQPQYPEFLHYYMAWCSGYREYLLGDSTTPVA